MTRKSAVRAALAAALLAVFCLPSAFAQVSLTTMGSAYTQSFDSLATSGTANAWSDNTTVPGWYAQFGTTANPTTYRADSGSSNTGAIYSWGVAGVNALGERAFGSVGSGGTGAVHYGVRLVNNTGATITSLDIAFVAEQWRQGGCSGVGCAPAAQNVEFQYQVANAGVITDANTPTSGWLDHNPLDFATPQPGATSTAAVLDGNAAANRIAKSSTLTVTVNPSQEIWLRWLDIDHPNNDHGHAVDEISITPQGAPAMPTLNIGDFSAIEGPSGTTTFTFAVTLTAPAGPGGVTFDIATADNTAQDDVPATDDEDYVANSLTGQTILAGSSGPYNFSVTVNGDNDAEPTETFFVDVTNITGATAGDVQGLGTIQTDDAPPDLTINDPSVPEGDGTIQFTVSLSAPAGPMGVVFDIATAPGTATAPPDYTHTAVTGATIPAGQQTYTFNVPLGTDPLFEPNETFFVNVTNVVGATVVDGQGVGTIQNDDAQPTFTIADVAQLEGQGPTSLMTFTVTMTGAAEASATVNWATGDGQATVGDADYVGGAGMLTFVSGDTSETFTVTINGDTTPEGDEHLNITLSGATVATIADASAFGVIKNDDAISINAVNTPFSETFDALHPATSPATPIGWTFSETGANANLTYSFGNGSSTTGDTYAFASAAIDPDRAFGGLQSGSLVPTIGAFYKNDTGTTITSLTIQYTGEQWRLGNAGRADRLDFQYSLDATSLTTGTWTHFDNLDFNSPNTTTTGALDGNAAGNRAQVLAMIPGLSIPNGQTFWVRFTDFNASGSDDGLAVDNWSIYANFTGAFISIGDVSALESVSPFTFTVTLSQPAPPGGVTFDIATSDGSANGGTDFTGFSLVGESIAAGNTSKTYNVTINNDVDPEPTENFFVTITNVTNALIQDPQGVGTIISDDVTITPIHDIQGPGTSSPIVASNVTIRGIVTGVKSNGFFVQEEDVEADMDPATSEGIFVFTSSAPPPAAAMGALVQVSGTVAEFVPSGDPQQPPLTELTTPTVAQISTGNPLPAPVVLNATFPAPAGAFNQLERVEGMRVTVSSMTVVGPTEGSFSETNGTGTSNGRFYGVVTGVPRPFREPGIQQPDTPPTGSIPPIPRWDTNPERLKVESAAINGQPVITVKSSDVLGPVTGPLDYGFRAYAILPDGTSAITVTPGTLPATPPAPAANDVTVASFNLQCFFDTVDDPGGDPVLTAAAYNLRLGKASIAIRNNMHMPDIIGVQEAEKLAVLQDLAARISSDAIVNTQPDPMYVAYLVEGNDVGGIDVGYLVKTAPVAPLLPRVSNIAVTQEGQATTWIDPDDNQPALLNDRPPLVLEATVNRAPGLSYDITVINNHLRSLIGIDSNAPDGLTTEGDRVRRKRLAQAGFLANLVQTRQTSDPAENIVLVGDFNAFEFNDGYVDVINVITGTPPPDNETVVPGDGVDLVNPNLDNLVDTPPASERYSYLHEGNAQNLDHVIVNQALITSTSARRVEHPRIDPDYPETERNTSTTPFRVSDHEPTIGYFTVPLLALSDFAVTLTHPTGFAAAGTQTSYTINVANNGPDAGNASMSIDLTAGTTFQSITPPAGWTCTGTTPAVGSTGLVTCTTTAPMAGLTNQNFTLTVNVGGSLAANTVLTRTATVDGGAADINAVNDSESENVTVVTGAQYYATKTVSAANYRRGDPITYTITIVNNKPFTQGDNVGNELVDNLPSGATLVSATASSGTVTTNLLSNSVIWNGSIASGGTVTITVNATVAVNASGVVSNQAVLNGDADNDGVNEADEPSDDPTVGGTADPTNFTVVPAIVAATKAVSGTFVSGTNITYTIVLTNNMALTQPNNFQHEFTDLLPAGITYVGCTASSGSCALVVAPDTFAWNGTIAPNGGQVTITITATITAASGTISNQGQSIFDTDDDASNDSSSLTDDPNTPALQDPTIFTIVPANSFSATKRDTAGSYIPGGSVTYQVVLTNTLAFTLGDNPGNEFTDVLPPALQLTSATASSGTAVATVGTNTVTWNGSIPSGGSVTITINAAIPPTATPGTVSNQGTASVDLDNNGSNETNVLTNDPDTPAASDPTSFVISSPSQVTATKSVSTSRVQGTGVTYTIVLTNNLPHTLADNAGAEFGDILPSSLQLVSASATSGTATATVGTNTVTWNGSIASGASVTITINATIAANATGTISNQGNANVDADNNGSNESNVVTDDPSTGTAGDATSFTVVASSAFTVTKRDTAGSYIPGGNVTWQVVLTNGWPHAQPDNAGNEFTDVLPPSLQLTSASASSGTAVATVGTNTVTWNGSIPAAGSVTITINAAIPPSATPGTVSNQGTASLDADNNGTSETNRVTDDPDTAAANDPTSFVITAPSQFTATKTVDTTGVQGTPATYTIVLTNNLPHALADNPGNEFSDVIPAPLQLQSASATSGTVVANTGTNTVTWNGSLASGASVTIEIDTLIPSNATPGTVSNQGTASIDADNNNTNESNVVTNDPSTGAAGDATAFTITSSAAASATKSVQTAATPGSTVTYTIVLTNNLGHTLQNNPGEEFVDVLPAQLILTGASATSGTVTTDVPARTVRWNGSLASGSSVTITITAQLDPNATGTVSNQGTFNVDLDNNGTNETPIVTDDPAVAGTGGATTFTAADQHDIPALSWEMLAALAAMLAAAAAWKMRA